MQDLELYIYLKKNIFTYCDNEILGILRSCLKLERKRWVQFNLRRVKEIVKYCVGIRPSNCKFIDS